MFDSHCLLYRKGVLSNVWEAAYFHKKLKKDQVTETNISSSVDKILIDEIPVLKYRVLGYLLLGIVRIYSKKVEYLLDDCQRFLIKVKDFVVRKEFNKDVEAFSAPYFSITLPKTFELDAFDLEVLEDISEGNVRPREEITLAADSLKNDGIRNHFLDQYHFEEVAPRLETCSTVSTPADVISSHLMSTGLFLSSSLDLSNMEASMEKFRENSFSQEECLDLELFHGVEIDIVRKLDEKCHTNGEEIKILDITSEEKRRQMTIEVSTNTFDASTKSKLQVTTEGDTVTNILDATPNSKLQDASGFATPELMIVQTPANKESARVPRKRKCLFDEIIVLPSEVLKKSIQNSSDLLRKRKKVPRNAYDSWKVCQIANLSRSFSEALIPCISIELRSLFSAKKLMTPELVIHVEAPDMVDVPKSPTTNELLKQTAIAPETPSVHLSATMVSEVPILVNSDRVVAASSFESLQQRPSTSDDPEFDVNLMNETNSHEEDELEETNEGSERTGMMVRYLCRSFLNQKKEKDEDTVNIALVLKGRAKKECARLFYEILVLKSRGFVDVEQQNAYDDIIVKKTLQTEIILGS